MRMNFEAALPRSGLLVVRRINWREEFPGQSPERLPAVSFPEERLRMLYRGIDGEPWPDGLSITPSVAEYGLASLEDYPTILGYYDHLDALVPRDLVYLSRPESDLPALLRSRFIFCGYDFGYYENATSSFSVLIHEVIFGQYLRLRAFVQTLNECALIGTLGDALHLNRVRLQLLESGADLENDTPCGAIAVYAVVENAHDSG